MADYLLDAEGLVRSYQGRGGSRVPIRAVDGVTLRVRRGEALGLVGESGSGKSTLARLLLAIERPDAGIVRFDGQPISHLPAGRVRPLRRRFQAVFQDPVSSLNPRLRVATIVGEPLVAHRLGSRTDQRRRIDELLAGVGLPGDTADRLPGAFSGGERQRIAIARALAPAPELVVLDEPVSALDVSVRAQVLDLLADLMFRFDLTLVLISHDPRVVRRLCDRVAVMFAGAIVETGPVASVFDRPAHPYTRDLLAATPHAGPQRAATGRRSAVAGRWPAGSCRYAGRCTLADTVCTAEPPLAELAGDHLAACWRSERATPAG